MNVVLQNEIITIVHDVHEDVPFVVYRPTMMEMDHWPTVYLYHGWSSSKEMQHIRAHLVTTMGYQVVVPDALYHGERGTLDYDEEEASQMHFWETVVQSVKEFPGLHEYCIDYYHVDRNRVATMGHSMGGVTAGGIALNCEGVQTSVLLNGSLDWEGLNAAYLRTVDEAGEARLAKSFPQAKGLDPAQWLREGKKLPILTLHGAEDPVVSKEPDRDLVDELYPHGGPVVYVEHPGVGHVVTTNMMGDAILWLGRNL